MMPEYKVREQREFLENGVKKLIIKSEDQKIDFSKFKIAFYLRYVGNDRFNDEIHTMEDFEEKTGTYSFEISLGHYEVLFVDIKMMTQANIDLENITIEQKLKSYQ